LGTKFTGLSSWVGGLFHLVQCPSKFQITANGDQRHAHVVRRPMRFIEYSAKSRQRGTMPYQRSRGSC
jgi:hypothetical protein